MLRGGISGAFSKSFSSGFRKCPAELAARVRVVWLRKSTFGGGIPDFRCHRAHPAGFGPQPRYRHSHRRSGCAQKRGVRVPEGAFLWPLNRRKLTLYLPARPTRNTINATTAKVYAEPAHASGVLAGNAVMAILGPEAFQKRDSGGKWRDPRHRAIGHVSCGLTTPANNGDIGSHLYKIEDHLVVAS